MINFSELQKLNSKYGKLATEMVSLEEMKEIVLNHDITRMTFAVEGHDSKGHNLTMRIRQFFVEDTSILNLITHNMLKHKEDMMDIERTFHEVKIVLEKEENND